MDILHNYNILHLTQSLDIVAWITHFMVLMMNVIIVNVDKDNNNNSYGHLRSHRYGKNGRTQEDREQVKC